MTNNTEVGDQLMRTQKDSLFSKAAKRLADCPHTKLATNGLRGHVLQPNLINNVTDDVAQSRIPASHGLYFANHAAISRNTSSRCSQVFGKCGAPG